MVIEIGLHCNGEPTELVLQVALLRKSAASIPLPRYAALIYCLYVYIQHLLTHVDMPYINNSGGLKELKKITEKINQQQTRLRHWIELSLGVWWSRGRAPDCQSRGRWFNPTYRRFVLFTPHLPVSFGRDETLKAGGPFCLMSMPGEVKDPTQGVNV